MTLATAATAAYLAVLALLSFNGLHRSWLLLVWLRRPKVPTPPLPAILPAVTVQLPLFDERHVVERAIRAIAALDWPRDRLHLQILDDSTDDTTERAQRVVDELAADGFRITLLHRADRTGFKAGALAAGLQSSVADFVAVFDADFVPPADFLRRVVPHLLADPGVGMVQARWGHLNADESWLTRAQATLLDGHFVVEHTARNVSGRWFNFNGTAGIWRRAAIDAGGGWQHDTLTEDLDLSYRAQLAGWRFVYVPDLVVPAELPRDMRSFKAQQHRWARGSIQTARKLLPRIWRSTASFGVKAEATTHLGANLSYPLVVVLTVLLPPAVAARALVSPGLLALDAVLFVAAFLPFVLFFGAAIVGSGAPDVRGRLLRLPVVLALGLGLALTQSRAVRDGFVGPVGTFVRTPKAGDAATSTYRAPASRVVWLEVAAAAYVGGAAIAAIAGGYPASAPFLLLFALGYGAVGWSSLRAS